MPEDAQKKAPDAETPPEQPKLQVREISSLTEIVEAYKQAPPQPEPIVLEWFTSASKEKPGGELMRLRIETRFPEDHWTFGIRYQTEIKQKLREMEADPTGKMVHKHPLADLEFIAKEVVVKPTWLHTASGLAKLKDSVSSITFSELRRKLMLAAGLDGDFFADYQQLTIPRTLLLSAYESLNASDNTQTPSGTPQPNGSSPGPSTTSSAEPKSVESASPTTSGSSPSTPTTAVPA